MSPECPPTPARQSALMSRSRHSIRLAMIASTERPYSAVLAATSMSSPDATQFNIATQRVSNLTSKPATSPTKPCATPIHPLGNFRFLPGEIRQQIWQSVLHNPTPNTPSSMALLRSSKSIYLEAIPELTHNLSLRLILDPARPLSVLVRDGNDATLPTLELPNGKINRSHALWKVPIGKIKRIQIDIFPAIASEPSELANLSTTIDRLVRHLVLIWPVLPAVRIHMRQSGPRVWWLKGGQRIRSVANWQYDIHICLPSFLPLRNCVSLRFTFEGHDPSETCGEVPWKILRITSCIERAAVSTVPFGKNLAPDLTAHYSSAAKAHLKSGRGWYRWDVAVFVESGNDRTVEQLLRVARRFVAPRYEMVHASVELPLRGGSFEEAFPALGGSKR